jgi:hypothetical protein
MSEVTFEGWASKVAGATGRTLGAYKSAAKKIGCSVEEWIERRTAGLRWCFRCRCWKHGHFFSVDATRLGGRSSTCKPCMSAASVASRYGTTARAVADMATRQEGCCAICGKARRLVVDHEHTSGRVRGLLCSRCNVGVGQFLDDVELLKSAIRYLEDHRG